MADSKPEKAMYVDTGEVFDASWLPPISPNWKQCSCAGMSFLFPRRNGGTQNARLISLRCRISATEKIKGRSYCWRHAKMLKSGKKVVHFPES